jgi:hypothetical protein
MENKIPYIIHVTLTNTWRPNNIPENVCDASGDE